MSSLIKVNSKDLLSAQSAKAIHRLGSTRAIYQATAASVSVAETLLVLSFDPLVGIVALDVVLEEAMDALEDLSIVISRYTLAGGSLETVATIAVDGATNATDAGAINVLSFVTTSLSYKLGDTFVVTKTYTAGAGSPTAPANNLIIQVE